MSENKKEDRHNCLHLCDLLPKMQIKRIKMNKHYKKAFLNRNQKGDAHHSPNNTTWD